VTVPAGFARPISPALGKAPTPVAAVWPAHRADGATISMTANGRACPRASKPRSTRTAGGIELVGRIRGPNFKLPDAARCGQLHPKVTQGSAAIAALAGRRRGADHGRGRSGPIASCARRHAAGDEPWQVAGFLRSQGDALGQTEAEAGRMKEAASSEAAKSAPAPA
jgi:hypothetical protein